MNSSLLPLGFGYFLQKQGVRDRAASLGGAQAAVLSDLGVALWGGMVCRLLVGRCPFAW